MVDGQRVVQQWIVRVDGVDLGEVKPGESVQIGRKPLRPLADEGVRRLEVQDSTRSMSKRHAMFSVAENGSASVRDLDSTNGSYVVRENGELMRIPADTDLLLPSSPVRLQFGDVPVDFIRVERHDMPKLHVPDLFGYALATNHQEPDAADMSVDDILNLRAGEPTTMFNAGQVRRRAGELGAETDVASPDHEDFGDGSVPLNVMPAAVPEEDESSRDLFEDAMNGAAEPADDPEPSIEDGPIPGSPDLPVADMVAKAVITAAVHESKPSAHPSGEIPTILPQTGDVPQIVEQPRSDAGAEPEPSGAFPSPDGPGVDEYAEGEPTGRAPADAGPEPMADGTEDGNEASQPADDVPLVFAPMDDAAPATDDADAGTVVPQDDAGQPDAYAPAFEPGSVFDRVSKGEFDRPEPAVEVGGHTSDEARRTDDFAAQYEMARHPQLLPFLAMNPSLYDDLYEWLAAQGDRDVDAALAHNEGYQEYRKAVGK